MSSCQRQRVVVLSLIPDMGHISPLLTLATRLADEGHAVVALLPDIVQMKVVRFRVEMSFYTFCTDHDVTVFGRTANYPAFAYFFVGDEAQDRAYFCPILRSLLANIDDIIQSVKDGKPDLIVTDNHPYFVGIAEAVALRLGVDLVLNEAHGNFGFRFLRHHPLRNLSAQLLGILNQAHKWLFRPSFTRLEKALRGKLSSSSYRQRERRRTTVVVSFGLPFMAKSLLNREIEGNVFPPIPRSRHGASLRASASDLWFSQRFVLVSFGTMYQPEAGFVDSLVEGLRLVGLPVLWSAGDQYREFLDRYSHVSNIRFEQFVDQFPILASGQVLLFVTHAGSSSVIEGIESAVPMLAIPLGFDQHYNATLVRDLGVGERIDKDRATSGSISHAISRILTSESLIQRIRYLEQWIGDCGSQMRVGDVLEKLRNQKSARGR